MGKSMYAMGGHIKHMCVYNREEGVRFFATLVCTYQLNDSFRPYNGSQHTVMKSEHDVMSQKRPGRQKEHLTTISSFYGCYFIF